MSASTEDYLRLEHRQPERLLTGPDAAVHWCLGAYRRRRQVLRQLLDQAGRIDADAGTFRNLSDHMLRERLETLRERFRRGGRAGETFLGQALAAIREAADRQIGLRPFPVQLAGALALHRGYLAEMATGEGKTLTAGLAAVLTGWTRRPCHIITVNDYLVQRDAEWLKNLYHFCGVTVGCVTGGLPVDERRGGYDCDVTYTTSKEVVADFLRDGLRVRSLRNPTRRLIRRMLEPYSAATEGLTQRGLHTAIVDEADSVLIDEAVVPLIIAAPRANEALREVVQSAQRVASSLEIGLDYTVDARYQEINLTKAGLAKIDEGCAVLSGLWRGPSRRLEWIRQALTAREFYQRGKQYVIADGHVLIIDEFTGRPMPQRTWRQGIHQSIEAKEGLQITDPTETIARLSFQRYFRLYHKLAGMTGTAREAAAEFWQIYQLPVVSIPRHRPCLRRELPDRIFRDEATKWQAVVEEVRAVHRTGQPLLIGTRSVAASEQLAGFLADEGLAFNLLNAVRHREEAQIIAEAGYKGRITIATNMAGRGTDIKLSPGVAELGGLRVLATERHESRRVDRQLFGRSGRQGDPGSAQAFVSAGDELFRRYLPAGVQRLVRQALAAPRPGAEALAAGALTLAQHTAQRQAFRQRRVVLKMDDWLDESLSFTGGATG